LPRILVAGCGYVGSRLASLLAEDGDRVWGLRRNPRDLPSGVTPLAADVTNVAALRTLPSGLDALVFAISPDSREPSAYRAVFELGLRTLLEAVRASSPDLSRTILVSSTGVYGQVDGRWVDEETLPEPADETASILLDAEAIVRAEGRGVALRLGGIYGPERNGTVTRVIRGEAGCPPPGRYGNRIHVDDAAGAVRHLLRLASFEDLYVGVDREPAALREVYLWLARRAGVADPCESARPSTDSAVDRRRRRSNKRCQSDRLVTSGYEFRYPTYREGYGPIVDGLVGVVPREGGEGIDEAPG
jgi:nucleoside-diphosphate-sugar epimerase